jgi:hypothetical protein
MELTPTSNPTNMEQKSIDNPAKNNPLTNTIDSTTTTIQATPCWCYRFRRHIIGPDQGKSSTHRVSRFIQHCRVLMCMQEPVAGLLFCTIAYVWICGLSNTGSDPFVQNLPVYLGANYNSSTVTTEEIAVASVLNSLFLLSTVIGVTVFFLVLFTYKCRKVTFAILMSAFFLTTFATPIYLVWMACFKYSITLDWPTLIFFSWNFAAVGTLLVHWEWLSETLESYQGRVYTKLADSIVNTHNWAIHVYLVLNAVGLTWPFSSMDEWTVWSFLILLVLWDLFAVLTPCGPLRYIMELERKRRLNGLNQFKLPPGLIYETNLFELGTGDLLFYGVVVGRSATLNYVTTACTALAIFTGMSATIWITVRSNMHALPALPLAIVLALLSLFLTRYLYVPYVNHLFLNGLYHI